MEKIFLVLMVSLIIAFSSCEFEAASESSSTTTQLVEDTPSTLPDQPIDEVDLIARLSKDLIPNASHQAHKDQNALVNYCMDKMLDVQRTELGIYYQIQEEGTGSFPTGSDEVIAHYRGTFLDGKEFDNSFSRGVPMRFTLRQVVVGWQQAIQMLKPGGKGVFLIPSIIAYGPEGNPAGGIPPNTPLVFEIELVDVNK